MYDLMRIYENTPFEPMILSSFRFTGPPILLSYFPYPRPNPPPLRALTVSLEQQAPENARHPCSPLPAVGPKKLAVNVQTMCAWHDPSGQDPDPAWEVITFYTLSSDFGVARNLSIHFLLV